MQVKDIDVIMAAFRKCIFIKVRQSVTALKIRGPLASLPASRILGYAILARLLSASV